QVLFLQPCLTPFSQSILMLPWILTARSFQMKGWLPRRGLSSPAPIEKPVHAVLYSRFRMFCPTRKDCDHISTSSSRSAPPYRWNTPTIGFEESAVLHSPARS